MYVLCCVLGFYIMIMDGCVEPHKHVLTYLPACRNMTLKLAHQHEQHLPLWSSGASLNHYNRKELTLYGASSVELGAKILVKQCSIGNFTKIGAKSKLNNCIVMDGVTIGEK